MKAFVVSQWRTFSTQTGIKGFSFLINAKTVAEKVIWAIALIVCSVLTIRDVYDTCLQFQSRPTMTSLQMNTDVPVLVPEAKICILFNPMTNIQLLRDTTPEKIFAHLDYVTNPIGLHENDTLMLSTATWLMAMTSVNEFHDSDTISVKDLSMANAARQSASYFHKYYMNSDYDFANATKNIASMLWKAMNLNVLSGSMYDLKNTTVDHASRDYVTWFGSSKSPTVCQMCSKIDPEFLRFPDRYNTVRITLLHQTVFTGRDVVFALYLGSSPLISGESENVVLLELGLRHTVFLHTIGQYKSLASKTGCQDAKTSKQECQLICRVKYVERVCKCSLLISAFIPTGSGLRFCKQLPNDQATCNSTVVLDSTDYCKTTCAHPCDRVLYIAEKEARVLEMANYPANMTTVDVRIGSFIYPRFEEVEAMDLKTLLSRLGGNLSLWIGASFLVLLHSVIFLMQMPLEFGKRKKTSTVQINHVFPTSDFN